MRECSQNINLVLRESHLNLVTENRCIDSVDMAVIRLYAGSLYLEPKMGLSQSFPNTIFGTIYLAPEGAVNP